MSDRGSTISTPRGNVCGVNIAAITPDKAAQLIVEAAHAQQRLQVHLCNAYTLSLVGKDPELRASLECADLNLPDGAPVAWLVRHLGAHGPVRGPQLMPAVTKLGATSGLRHYLWGGGAGVAEQVAVRLKELEPTVRLVAWETPPYSELDDDDVRALADRVKMTGADILWVGLGTPRQDYLIPRISPLLSCPVVPVGAAFDFLAGRIPEAPRLFHGSGLEWIYRLAREPRRLWRRYLIGNPVFVLSAARHRFKNK